MAYYIPAKSSRILPLPVLLLLCAVALDRLHSTGSSSAPDDGGRIVGGFETSIAAFPYMLSLQVEGTHICGAALLTRSVAITAAHCVAEHTQSQLYSLRAGSSQHAQGGTLALLLRIIPHEDFNRPTLMNNDIALLALRQPLTYSRFIKPIAIASPTELAAAAPWSDLFISGWGAMSSGLRYKSPRLRYAVIQQQDQARCTAAYVGAATINDNMLCAGSTANGGRDSCQGDSGGPLTMRLGGGIMKLRGIVSWGLGCGHQSYPGVYTRLSQYGDWISRNMATIVGQ